jgi:signal transduction histidine kinase/CheY-like chemotaxis protein
LTRRGLRTNPGFYYAVAATGAAAFVIDAVTPLGVAVWLLYLLPVALCVFTADPRLPFLAGAAATLLIIAGYFLSPAGVAVHPALPQINRVLAIAAVWSMAIPGYYFIEGRLRLHRFAWLNDVQSRIAHQMLDERAAAEVAQAALTAFGRALPLGVGAIYLVQGGRLQRLATWAVDAESAPSELEIGQGLLGQAVAEKRPMVLRTVSATYLRVRSALGGEPPRAIVVAPFAADGGADGAIELGLVDASAVDDALELMERVSNAVGMALRSAAYRERLQQLLEETQRQSEELAAQQEELKVSNEELEEHGRALRESQARLENQAAELEQSNLQLEEQTHRLERQREDLLTTQAALRRNAEELERSSRYKSEFLANMSHELRTPLNSSMILSKLLVDNRDGNLTAEQVRYAQIIRSANNELLALINDILDLSKIESGHVELDIKPVDLNGELEALRQMFEPVAAQRQLRFRIEQAPQAPAAMSTDAIRLQQILKNLLSNAFKFTEAGEVVLAVGGDREQAVFTVRDTGIGIPESQQQVIFEAFRQADGTTSRKYGGTGLGLSICRELAHLLGGRIDVQSAPGKGSAFTLRLPVTPRSSSEPAAPQVPDAPNVIPATQATARPAPPTERPARVILVIEHDERFAATLCQLVEELDFRCVVVHDAVTGIERARELLPSAILLEEALPDGDGSAVIEQLQRDQATRRIPVHTVSASKQSANGSASEASRRSLKPIAREKLVETLHRLQGPLPRQVRRVLVVEDDEAASRGIAQALSAAAIECVVVDTMAGALEQLAGTTGTTFDGVVLDLSLPDGSGYELLAKMAEGGDYAFPPVIVHTGRALSSQEEQQLRRYSSSIIIKGPRSTQRLLDEVSLFLHRVEAELPPEQRRARHEARHRDASLDGRVLLLAEDDVRNVFSLSRVFEPLGAELEIARNGREALEALERRPGIDLVLMDVMMPEMDGLAAMREIRRQPRYESLPIIALTAKAMPDDRQRCLDAGASDYIAKPIDVDKLVSLVRVWMPR